MSQRDAPTRAEAGTVIGVRDGHFAIRPETIVDAHVGLVDTFVDGLEIVDDVMPESEPAAAHAGHQVTHTFLERGIIGSLLKTAWHHR
jgi:hypothetical protein